MNKCIKVLMATTVMLSMLVGTTFGDTLQAPTTTRIIGKNVYRTSFNETNTVWKAGDTSDTAILCTGEDFYHAIAAEVLCKKYNAPLLLTPKASLDGYTEQTLVRLAVKKVIIVGDTDSITQNVENLVKAHGITTERILGSNPAEVSVNVAKTLDNVQKLVVVGKARYADALSIASISAANNMPIIFSDATTIPKCISDYITAQKIDTTYVIGGTGQLSTDVQLQFPGNKRLVGVNKYDTDAVILKEFKDKINFTNIYSTTGENWKDGISAVATAVKAGSPLVLVSNDDNSSNRNLLSGLGVKTNTLVGGYVTTSNAKVDELFTAPIVPKIAVPQGNLIDIINSTGNYIFSVNNDYERVIAPADKNLHFNIVEYSNNGQGTEKHEINLLQLDENTRNAVKGVLKIIAPNEYETIYKYLIWTIRGDAFEFGNREATVSTFDRMLDNRSYRAYWDDSLAKVHLGFTSYNTTARLIDYITPFSNTPNTSMANESIYQYVIKEYNVYETDRTEYENTKMKEYNNWIARNYTENLNGDYYLNGY